MSPYGQGRRRLDTLTDRQLHALLARVQALLDRPHNGTDADVAVDLVRGDEERLLALYRTLPPSRRRDCLALMEGMRDAARPPDGIAPRPAAAMPVAGASCHQ